MFFLEGEDRNPFQLGHENWGVWAAGSADWEVWWRGRGEGSWAGPQGTGRHVSSSRSHDVGGASSPMLWICFSRAQVRGHALPVHPCPWKLQGWQDFQVDGADRKKGRRRVHQEASSIEAKAWTEQLQDQLGANRIYNFPTLRNLSFLSLSHSLNCSSSGVPVSAKDTILHLSLGVTSSRKLPYFTLPSSGHVRLIWPGTSVRP